MPVTENQAQTCRRFGVVPAPPAPHTMVAIAPSRGAELLPLNAVRHPVDGQSNGWYVWRGGDIPQDQDDFFVPCHVEHLPEYIQEVTPYLALPPGWSLVLAPGYEDVRYDKSLLTV